MSYSYVCKGERLRRKSFSFPVKKKKVKTYLTVTIGIPDFLKDFC